MLMYAEIIEQIIIFLQLMRNINFLREGKDIFHAGFLLLSENWFQRIYVLLYKLICAVQ